MALAHKKQAVPASHHSHNPLRDACLLQEVFTFLPAGNWLFLGAVCSDWKAVYAGRADQEVQCLTYDSNFRRFFKTCGPTTTFYSAAVASPATAGLAACCGLAISEQNYNLHVAAGLTADIQTLAALFELGMPLNRTVVCAVALSARLEVLQHIGTLQQCPRPFALSQYAARSGSIVMLNWLRDESWCTFDQCTCAGAAEGGHLSLLQHLRSEGCEWDNKQIACYAASSGSIEVVDWLRQQQGVIINARTLASAARAGHIAMCEYLRSVGCDWDTDACWWAADWGHLDTLHWLREHGCPWDTSEVRFNALYSGKRHILNYALQHGALC
jgi:hypothetical protein